jgi:uncharacterized membrane protein YsdA (DUF1294 family)
MRPSRPVAIATPRQPDLDLLFKSAKRAHDRGNLKDALDLYKTIGDKNPYYPGLDIQVRALEMEMTRGFGHPGRRSGPVRQPAPATHSQSARPARRPAGHTNPYLLYGILTFLPAVILTLILALALPPDSDIILIWLLVINVITFFVYGYDKLISPTQTVRVPELILLMQVLLGAFVLAPIARTVFRHKTQKLSFRVKFWVVEAICIAWVALYFILTRLSGQT